MKITKKNDNFDIFFKIIISRKNLTNVTVRLTN